MENKKVLLENEHLNNIKEALDSIENVVSKTMGPAGSNVLIDRKYLPPIITKDGATVAEHFYLNDNRSSIINLVKYVTRKTALDSGDGTTTTTVLIKSFFNKFIDQLNSVNENKKVRVLKVTNYIREITNDLINELNLISKKVDSIDKLRNIISISTNQDDYMTDALIKAINIKDNNEIDDAENREILVRFSKTGNEYIDINNGSKYESGYSNILFCNDKTKTKIEYTNPLIVVSADKIHNMKQLTGVISIAMNESKPLILIAPEYDPDVLATLVMNKLKNIVNIAALNAPGSGGLDTENYLEDIAYLSGCNIVKNGTAFTFSTLDERIIGRNIVDIKVEENNFTIVSNIDKNKIKLKLDELKNLLNENSNNPIKKDSIMKRIRKFKNGVSTIYINSNSEVELMERKDRFEDAIGAFRSAVSEGYVPGSATTYLKLASLIDSNKKEDINYKIASSILKEGLKEPFKRLIKNAQIDNEITTSLINLDKNILDKNISIDLFSEEEINLLDSGIIDPTKVIRCSIENSISLVSTLVSSKCSILNENNEIE